eukprot:551838-Prymnesium_polylepis.1
MKCQRKPPNSVMWAAPLSRRGSVPPAVSAPPSPPPFCSRRRLCSSGLFTCPSCASGTAP